MLSQFQMFEHKVIQTLAEFISSTWDELKHTDKTTL